MVGGSVVNLVTVLFTIFSMLWIIPFYGLTELPDAMRTAIITTAAPSATPIIIYNCSVYNTTV